MITHYAEFPPCKSDLLKHYGYLSFQTALINVDIIGIRIVKSYEVVVITYRSANKTGFIYEGGNLTQEQVLRVYKDAPEDKNDLENWEQSMDGKIEILVPAKNNYVFINDREVVRSGKMQTVSRKKK